MKSALVLLVWLITAGTVSQPVRAQHERRALIITDEASGSTLAELSARLRGELSAAGFSVASSSCAPGVAPSAAISAAPSDAIAVILVRGELHGAQGVELWISDRVLGGTSNARLRSDHPDPSERARRISVEAAELLRARLAELQLDGSEPPPPAAAPQPANEVVVRGAAARADSGSGWFGRGAAGPFLAGGLMVLQQPGHEQLTLMPSLSVGWAWGSTAQRAGLYLSLGVSASGYGQAIRREREQGNLTLRQGLGTIDAALRWVSRIPVQPELWLTAGLYGLGLRGEGVAPYHGLRQRDFMGLFGAAFALRIRLFSRLWLRAATGPLRALESTSVQIVETTVARAGGLMWASRVELLGVLW